MVAASLIYDFLLAPQARNFNTRAGIPLHGQEEENGSKERAKAESVAKTVKNVKYFSFSVLFFFTLLVLILILQCVSLHVLFEPWLL